MGLEFRVSGMEIAKAGVFSKPFLLSEESIRLHSEPKPQTLGSSLKPKPLTIYIYIYILYFLLYTHDIYIHTYIYIY